jgi:hypothetical protein
MQKRWPLLTLVQKCEWGGFLPRPAMQVFSFYSWHDIGCEKILDAINSAGIPGLRAWRAQQVPRSFHATFAVRASPACVCVCVCMCVCIDECVCMCIYICMYVCIYVCFHACICVCVCMYVYLHRFTKNSILSHHDAMTLSIATLGITTFSLTKHNI